VLTSIDAELFAGAVIPQPDILNYLTSTWKKKFKLPQREAGPPNHLDD